MRRGAVISGSLHAALLALAVFGTDWFRDRAPVPLNVTEIEMVDGAELDARLSTAPVVQSEGPADLAPPAPGESVPIPETRADSATPSEAAATLAEAAPPEPRPETPRADIPPPPMEIPSEAPVPTIAEIPSPDPLPEQAARPESPASTEPVTPLASASPPPSPSPRPAPPEAEPEPQPAPAPEPEPEAEPEPVEETVPQPRAAEPAEPDRQEPEPEAAPEEPEETELASAAPDNPAAPESLAPREARLPVARPAERARAAPASSRPEPAPQQVAEEEPVEEEAEEQATEVAESEAEPKPADQPQRTAEAEPAAAEPAGGSSRPTAPLNHGEENALRLGIKEHYTYNGDRSDPNLQVTIRVTLTEQGMIEGKPEIVGTEGGTSASQAALARAGRAALIYAQNAGEFDKLPADKYGAWRVLTVVFTTRDEVLF